MFASLRWFSPTGAIVISLLLATNARSALAQSSTPLDQLTLSPAGDALLTVPDADSNGWVAPAFGAIFSYAHDPIVLSSTDGELVSHVVESQLVLHTLASITLVDRLTASVDVPVAIFQDGDALAASTFPSASGATMQDLRFGLRATLLKQRGFWPAIGTSIDLFVPTGDDDRFGGTSSARVAANVGVGARYERLSWGASIGRRFEPTEDSLLGSTVDLRTGVLGILGPIHLGPEFLVSTVADAGIEAFSRRALHAEGLFVVRGLIGPVTLSAAGGPGFTHAPGTPLFRVLAGASVAFDTVPRPAPKAASTDGTGKDGGLGKDAARPLSPAAALDRDGDGVPNDVDLCPNQVGADAKRRGCPTDADGDGFADLADACPKEAGVATGDAATEGCPPDTDGDTIRDAVDACPRERGLPSSDPKANGCPETLRVESTKIVTLQQVNFKTGSAEITPASFALLKDIASVLEKDPSIARMGVDGHTDNRGNAAANVLLSQQRAVAVVRFLTEVGKVDVRRLEARGFGPKQPLVDNATEEGRSKNRRVEFIILKRTTRGANGWEEGTLDTPAEPGAAKP